MNTLAKGVLPFAKEFNFFAKKTLTVTKFDFRIDHYRVGRAAVCYRYEANRAVLDSVLPYAAYFYIDNLYTVGGHRNICPIRGAIHRKTPPGAGS